MPVNIDGIFIRPDLTEYITESFANKYCIDLTKWVYPFGYFDEFNNSIISNGPIPDGTYVILGKITYPGASRYSHHIVAQFNLCRNRGDELTIVNKFNPYLDVPLELPLRPVYPMFKVGPATHFRPLIAKFKEVSENWFTIEELKSKIEKVGKNSTIGKIYCLKLAVLTDLNRGK